MTALAPLLARRHVLERGELEGTATFGELPGHFGLHYQPQIDLGSGAIDRCEARLRWHHPEHGLLRPQRTLDGTRWSDDIVELEEWALLEACRQRAAWARAGTQIEVALSVSPSFLLGAGFHRALGRALGESGISPSGLAIDVPARVLATHPADVLEVIGDLIAEDVGVVIDGVTGDALPWAIDRIPAQAWKVHLGRERHGQRHLDPSGVRAVDHAHAAGVLAIATAVEDDGELATVRSAGFDGAFGTVVSPPLPADEAFRAFRPAPRPMPPLFGVGTR